jgi:predicted enzyme related to lactoylglutathione lyase
MDDAQIVALLSSIEPSEGEIPKPPFMAAIPAGPVLSAGADVDAVDAWVKARGGWTHRQPAHMASPDGQREPLFFIVPRGHLQTRPGGGAPFVPTQRGAAAPRPYVPTPAGAPGGATGAPGAVAGSPGAVPGAPAKGLAGADLMAFAATSDLPAARAFYERGLGLPMTGQSPIACTFDAGGTTLRVVLVEKPVIAPYTMLGWTVADIRATITDLNGRGIDFERFDGVEQDELGIWSAPGGAFVAWFKDPDGNVLSLTQF